MNIAILAGGRGKRMGYVEKSQIKICGRRIIDILLERFRNCNVVIVCRDIKQAEMFNHECICDRVKNFGPLSGIYSALEYFEDHTAVIATDMPFVRRNVVEEIFKKAKELNTSALIPYWRDGKFEPMLAVYSPEVMGEIERSFRKNERKILDPIFRCRNVFLYDIECLRKLDKQLLSFFNINTHDDLKRAEEICSSIDLGEL